MRSTFMTSQTFKAQLQYATAAIVESNESSGHNTKQISDLLLLFRQLHENGIKIAICTADSR